MTDREKIIASLGNALVQMHGCGTYTAEDVDELETAAWKALELLEEQLKKQEAKPVKITKNAYNYEFYHCPNCDRGFDLTYYKRPAYCDKCGQELKWDD